ncbi:MAG TPA: HAMP domain-containing sensor histidine kinase [Candidatus Xenobia bacterium]|nr:HAMP domain-containing sensor histidine kinase [Candidatus Xenobia bacterium]
MKQKKWWRWDARMRMLLTLELAIVLPAAALIAFSVWNLRSLYRDKTIEAAIQRDFQQFLAIAEKRINKRMFQQVGEIRQQFGALQEPPPQRLEKLIESRPSLAHAFYFDPKQGFTLRSCKYLLQNPEFRKEAEYTAVNMATWMPMEAKDYVLKLRRMEGSDPDPYILYERWQMRGDEKVYQVVAYFLPPDLPGDKVALAGVIFDSDYLKNDFFPAALNHLTTLKNESGTDSDHPKVAIMVRPRGKDTKLLAASTGWDGEAEVERNFDAVFRSMMLGVKFTGTTVNAIAHSFLHTYAFILGALSLLMAGGIWLTYHNVTREMALAKLKSDFVSNVSHELRTPLALVRLFAETLEMGRVNPDKYQEYFRIIRKESERLTALINNILDFSRIEAGKKEYDFRETDMAELVRETLDTYRYQIEDLGFQLEVQLANDVPRLRVDREAIARSLLNLVNNAVKYSPKEKYLGVKLWRDNGEVKLEVADRGIGIPRSEQNKVFEKFYRVGDPLVHNTKGSGLGLSLVRHIVQAHGGAVRVESAVGRGSRFTIALPVNCPAAPSQTTSGD